MKGHKKSCLGGGRGVETYTVFFKNTYFLGFFSGVWGFRFFLFFGVFLLLFSTK